MIKGFSQENPFSFASNYICSMRELVSALLLYGLMCQTAFAQVTQTLGLDNYNDGTEILYTSPNGGYAFGNNGYNDLVKAQVFTNDNSFVLREAQFKLGVAEFGSTDSTSSLVVNLYRIGAAGINIFGALDSIAPDEIIATDTLPVYDLEAGGMLTTTNFNGETLVFYPNDRFAVGIDLSQMTVGDTVALYSTTDEDAGGTGNAWELTADSNWVAIAQDAFGWGLDVDLAIFVAIDENDPASVQDYQESEWNIYPNPVNDVFLISNGFIGNGDFSIRIFNSIGQEVYFNTSVIGSKSLFDISQFKAGVYLVQLENSGVLSSKKLIKQ